MKQQRLGFVGLGDDTASACLSMLKIMDGRSGISWSLSDPDAADVLMVANESTDETRRWEHTSKPRIVVYHHNEPKPSASHVLQHPFRVMQLLSVLEDVASLLAPTQSQTPLKTDLPPSSIQAGAEAADVGEFWDSLHELLYGDFPAAAHWYVAQSDEGELWLDARSRRFMADPLLLKRMMPHNIRPGVLRACNAPATEGAVACSLFAMSWMITPHLPAGLSSWISADSAFQLLRWPSFGSLAKSRSDLTLCALLTKKALTRDQVLSLSQAAEDDTDRFINACAMSGLMRYDKADLQTLPGVSAEAAGSRFGGLIKGLRSRLGLSA